MSYMDAAEVAGRVANSTTIPLPPSKGHVGALQV
jgi:hypothetical protein